MRRIGIIRVEDGDTYSFKLDIWDTLSGDFVLKGISPSAQKAETYFLDLPIHMLGFRVLTLPFSDKKRIDEVIPFELQGYIIEDMNEVLFDSFCLGKDGDVFNILVVYVKKGRLKHIIEALQKYSIDPVVAGSIEIRHMLKETTDPNVITRRLFDQWAKKEKEANVNFDLKEELLNPTINLRRDELAFKGDILGLRRTYRGMVILLIMLAVMINLNLSLKLIKDGRDINAIKKESRKIYTQLFPSEKKITDEYYQLKAHLKEVKERKEITGSVQALDLLYHLASIHSENITINETSLSMEGLSIKGEASSMDEVDRFKSGLSKVLSDINITDVKGTSGRFGFTLSGRLKR